MSTTPDKLASALDELYKLHTAFGSIIATGDAGSVAPMHDLIVKRPWIDPPDGFQPFDYQAGINLPAIGAGFVVVLSLIVPDGMDGVINYFSCNVTGAGFNDFSGDIVWQVTRNGAPVRGFDNIQNQKGSLQQPREINPIRIYTGQVVQLLVNHPSNIGLTGQIVGGFMGYYYPSKG